MSASRSGEFDLIARYFAPLAAGAPGALGLSDDAATFAVPAGCEAVITADAMVEDVHFRRSDGAALIARKLLRVNLSDLASEGARPIGYVLTTAWPHDLNEDWIAAFASGLAEDQAAFGVSLLGGDTVATRSVMTFSLTAIGAVPLGRAMRRRGARPGDRICVSGTIGDAGLALALERYGGRAEAERWMAALRPRLLLPEPRLALGQRLSGIAHAAIDVSDGLAQDCRHIASASAVKMILDTRQVPRSPMAADVLAACPELLPEALAGGDDYELAFTVAEQQVEQLADIGRETGVGISVIGRVEEGQGIDIIGPDGEPLALERLGYSHF